MTGALPGQTVVSLDGSRRGVIEKGLGGGDFIVRWRDGRREAIHQREFEISPPTRTQPLAPITQKSRVETTHESGPVDLLRFQGPPTESDKGSSSDGTSDNEEDRGDT